MGVDRRAHRRWLLLLVVGPALAVSAATTSASTFRHDVPEEAYVDYGDGFFAVGGVTFSPDALSPPTSFGSGVLIHPEWVLTAAHVIGQATSNSLIRFEMDPDPADDDELPLSGFYFVKAFAIHEYYDDPLGPAGGFDLALLQLERPVHYHDGWQRIPRSSTPNPELGLSGTAVGFGATGTGKTGFDPETGGFFRLAVQQMVDGVADDPRIVHEFAARDVTDPLTGLPVHFTREQIAAQFLLSDFDDPATRLDDPLTTSIDESYTNDGLNPLGSDIPLALEGSVAPGDSGGPLFVDIGGQFYLAGINSFIHGLEPPDGDGTDNASYSDLSGYLRVSAFQDWIDGVIAVPEPGSAALIGAAAAAALLGRRRRPRHAA